MWTWKIGKPPVAPEHTVFNVGQAKSLAFNDIGSSLEKDRTPRRDSVTLFLKSSWITAFITSALYRLIQKAS